MSRVVAVVEGQTEQDFVRNVLAPWLATRGVYLTARLVGKPGHKGGVGEYQRAKTDILVVLKTDAKVFATTMFDFYGMPNSWPAREDAAKASHAEKAQLVENAVRQDISRDMGPAFQTSRFLPYIQMYEFESLLFSKPSAVCEVLRSPKQLTQVEQIRASFANPEEINDGPQTAPSKRLLRVFSDYRKRLHGLISANRIGLQEMRSECPHFNEWVERLEALG